MRPLHVRGCGLWAPGVASWQARAAGHHDPQHTEPPCAEVPARLLRGTSLVTRIAVEVAAQAATEGEASRADVATVFASELGEIQTAVALLAMIHREGLPSPIRFKNSVHNAASGTASIAWQNPRFSTALSAGLDLVAMALLEAWAWLDLHSGDLIVVFAEEEIPAVLSPQGSHPPLGVAFLLSTRPGGPHKTTLRGLRRDPTVGAAIVPADHAHNACAVALALLDCITERRRATLPLSLDAASPWCVEVSPEAPCV